MPSIIEVDTIKNKTGTQNTVLSTDGSGNNTLNAGVIKSNTGSNTGLSIASDGQITVNQNNPTITLGANTTFPSGHILQVKVFNGKSGSSFATSLTSYQDLPNTDWESDIYPNITITGGNKIFVSTQMECLISSGGADNQGFYRLYDVTNTTARGHEGNMYSYNDNAHDRFECAYVNIHALFTQSSSAKQEFTFSVKAGSGGAVDVWHEYSSMTLMEIQA